MHIDSQALRRQKTFAVDYLPWVITGGAVVWFLATLNHWVTISSVGFVGQVGGWMWPGNQLSPLAYLGTLPFRKLSDGSLPFALNAFTAVLAALTLGQLARCVALFPHDRTHAQRERETSEHSLLTHKFAWLPPLFAALVGGLQSTFWEHSVVATGEMMELVLFACVVRTLLEFRLTGNNSWAYRAALIYGALMANDWLLTGLLPFFIGALIWMRGVAFFNLKFLLRMAGLGLLGFALVLLMPWVQSHQSGSFNTFGEILKANLAMQKNILVHFQIKQFWMLGLTSLIPFGLISIRWPASFGDNSPMGAAIAALIFHIAHAVFLLVGLWVLFDPPFSPRLVLGGASWLPLYFISALCLGYFVGYFLLVFGKKPRARGFAPPPTSPLAPFVVAALMVVVIAAPTLLVVKNLPPIRAMNQPLLRNFTHALVAELPERDSIVMADDAVSYLIGIAAFHSGDTPRQHILLNSHLMLYAPYHRHLATTYGARLNDQLGATTNLVLADSTQLVQLLTKASETQPVSYLHYSFGYYFEKFALDPHGLIFRLQNMPTNQLAPPVADADTIARNEKFWQTAEQKTFPYLTAQIALLAKGPSQNSLVRHLNLAPIADGQAVTLAVLYSRALDWWAVQLQRAGKLPEARHRFEQALALNQGNLAASINLAFNANLLTNSTTPVTLSRQLEDQLHGYSQWDNFLAQNGPVDEPQFCYQQGVVFAQGGIYHQAAEQLARVTELDPKNLAAQLLLANVQNAAHFSDDALKTLRTARKLANARDAQSEILFAQTTAYFDKHEPQKAELLIETALDAEPRDTALLASSLQNYLTHGQLTNALGVIRRQLALNADDPDALVNQSYVHLQLAQFTDAIAALNHLLDLQPTNAPARLNRAIASLQTG
ncbi:MAG: hypothetical protein RLZZ350_691, partial [Verrucomicrobiota bacterium]